MSETNALAPFLAAEQGQLVPPVSSGQSAGPAETGARALVRRPNAPDPDALVPITKAENQKLGRNEPCWCGSGKKFKLCHGAG